MARLILQLLCIWTSIVSAFTAFCPKECYCREMNTFSINNVYVVTRYHRNLTKIPDLSGLQTITLPIYLKLSYSSITRVTRKDFPPSVAITHLNLGGNSHLVIEDDAFTNLSGSLVYLNLEATKVFFNKTLIFLKGLSTLETLILSENNKHENVKVNLFDGLMLSSLVNLQMFNCGIKTMDDRVLQGVETVTDLDLAANQLIDVPAAVARLRDLKSLDLSNSFFKVIRNKTFVSNTKLSTLLMIASKLQTIESAAFTGLDTSLRRLVLKQTHLTEVPVAALRNLKGLTDLSLEESQITSISPGSFSGAYCLKTLNLIGMEITFSKDMFKGQWNCIQYLFLRKMKLKSIPISSVSPLQKLNNLYLNDNLIEEIEPNSLSGIKASSFDLDGNPLRTLAKDVFKGTTRPLYLSLKYTQLKSLQFVLDYPKGTFRSLDVTGISIPCDCTTAKAVKIMEKDILAGTCGIIKTGAGIGLQTDTAYKYLTKLCPKVMTSGTCAVKERGTLTLSMFLLASAVGNIAGLFESF